VAVINALVAASSRGVAVKIVEVRNSSSRLKIVRQLLRFIPTVRTHRNSLPLERKWASLIGLSSQEMEECSILSLWLLMTQVSFRL
jgi:hypothetical protein